MRAAVSITMLVAALSGLTDAQARTPRQREYGSGVPYLDVEGSCRDAQKFSIGDEKATAYKGCIQDERAAKDQLNQKWSTFKAKDKQTCVEQARAPSPSYVEVLTCLEMNSGVMTAPRDTNKPAAPAIGGPQAPGLPNMPATPATPSTSSTTPAVPSAK